MTINIVLSRLDSGIDAETIPNEDGTYTIRLDKNLCREKALHELVHELKHIKSNDFESDLQTDLLERMGRESNFIEESFKGVNFYYHVCD
jgi:hypothetical protein